jgi:PAS domain S-box-containing protein
MIEIPDQIYKDLSDSEQRYKSLVKALPDAVTMTDLEGRVTEVSKQTLELHGFSRESELIGKSAFELIAPEDHERAAANLKKTLEEGSAMNLEYILLKKDGSRFIGELNASLIKDKDGKPKAFIATTRDITWRKRLENEIRASEFLYRSLAEPAQDFIFILDGEGKIHYVNRYCAEQTGVAADKIIGRKLEDLFPPQLVERAKWDLNRVIDSGESLSSDVQIPLAGKNLWLEARLIPLNKDDRGNRRVLGMARDMTKYKAIEDDLRAKMKELKEFNDLAVGRELQLIEMGKEIERLKRLAGPDEVLDLQK